MEQITNVPKPPVDEHANGAEGNTKLTNMSLDDVLAKVYGLLSGNLSLPEQNKAISLLLERMYKDRAGFLESKQLSAKEISEEIDRALKIKEEFLNIVRNS